MLNTEKIQDVTGCRPEDCEIVFRVHATQRMYQRNINHEDVLDLLNNGVVIEKYDNDLRKVP